MLRKIIFGGSIVTAAVASQVYYDMTTDLIAEGMDEKTKTVVTGRLQLGPRPSNRRRYLNVNERCSSVVMPCSFFAVQRVGGLVGINVRPTLIIEAADESVEQDNIHPRVCFDSCYIGRVGFRKRNGCSHD